MRVVPRHLRLMTT